MRRDSERNPRNGVTVYPTIHTHTRHLPRPKTGLCSCVHTTHSHKILTPLHSVPFIVLRCVGGGGG